jgi:hypothetical protein
MEAHPGSDMGVMPEDVCIIRFGGGRCSLLSVGECLAKGREKVGRDRWKGKQRFVTFMCIHLL